MEALDSVKASLNYTALPEQADHKPEFWLYQPEPGTPQHLPRVERHTLAIHDARPLLGRLSLETEGVELVRHETAVEDLYDAEAVRERYYPEMGRLVAELTGAARVVAFDHNVRCATRAEQRRDGAQMPVKSAHNDYTERSAPQRVRDLLGNEAEALLARRFAVINVWRPIRGPVRDMPLAVCDARSIAPGDLLATDLVYRERTGEVYSLAFNPEHRWLYFPNMARDETMLIKCYDSAADGRARFTAHTAFSDPTRPADAPARESIETRTLAFFAS